MPGNMFNTDEAPGTDSLHGGDNEPIQDSKESESYDGPLYNSDLMFEGSRYLEWKSMS